MTPLCFVTGFGPFLDVRENPSRALAAGLAADPPSELRVRAVELPVSFRRGPLALDAALADPSLPVPDLLLGLGVHRGPSFRFERRARACPPWSERVDNDGVRGAELGRRAAPDLWCAFDLEALAAVASAAGALAVELSEDAGGYVCERLDRHLLERGRLLERPALFLHVPAVEHQPVERSLPILRALAAELARQVCAGTARPPSRLSE